MLLVAIGFSKRLINHIKSFSSSEYISPLNLKYNSFRGGMQVAIVAQEECDSSALKAQKKMQQ